MKHQFPLVLSLLSLALIVIGCSQPSPDTVPTLPPLSTSHPSATLNWTETPPVPTITAWATATASATLVPAATPTPGAIPECSQSASRQVTELTGRVLYVQDSALHFVGGSPLSTYDIPAPDVADYDIIGFSPDGNWLAFAEIKNFDYEDTEKSIAMVFVSANGRVIKQRIDLSQFTGEPGMFVSGLYDTPEWINNDVLYVPLMMQTLPIGSQWLLPLPKVYNPFTNTWRTDITDDIPSFDQSTTGGFSPDLDRLLYVHPPRNGKSYLLLWDIRELKTLWTDDELMMWDGAFVSWAPDGSVVAYTNQDFGAADYDPRVFLLSRNGGPREPITSLDFPMSKAEYGGLSWSHSGRFLAFNGKAQDAGFDDGSTLYIYDRNTSNILVQCKTSGPYTSSLSWSPDDQYLLLSGSTVDLLDATTAEVVRLVDQGTGKGWTSQFDMKFWPFGPLLQ